MLAIVNAIVPVFIVAGLGYAVRRRFHLDAKTLSTLNIYLFIPALIFANLAESRIPWRLFGQFALASALAVALLAALSTGVARLRGIRGSMHSAFMLCIFPNLGNFGLPVVKFAFGDKALEFALLILVCGSLMQNSLGVYFAQRSRHGVGKAFLRVFQFPMVYAFLLALLFQHMHWRLPASAANAVSLTAEAAIPVQLMILGLKVAETRLRLDANVLLAASLRLLAGPAVVAIVALVLGLEGLPARVFILQMSGPVAVGMAAFGVQFDVEPGFLANAVSASFLFSLLTVSTVLYALLLFPL